MEQIEEALVGQMIRPESLDGTTRKKAEVGGDTQAAGGEALGCGGTPGV
jgi:hypothetical protein